MPRRINIIVTCTKRKTLPPAPGLRMRDITGATIIARARAWVDALTRASSRTPARDIYAGDHWSICRELPHAAEKRGFVARLWVISTGYGLISADTPIAPYSATFSPTHPDSVARGHPRDRDAPVFTQWWARMCDWCGPDGGPRSLAELARRHPDQWMLVVASAAYLGAVRDDLTQAAEVLNDRGSLLIISGGTKSMPALQDALLPLDARMQNRLGGARRTLNVRAARQVIAQISPNDANVAALCQRYARMLDRLPPAPVLSRERISDEQVLAFIQEGLRQDGLASATGLLRELRANDQACEQSRFKRLFQFVTRSRHASDRH